MAPGSQTRAQLAGELSRARERLAELEALMAVRPAGTRADSLDHEERLARLLDGIPLAYQSLDSEGRLVEVSQAWLDLLGYSRGEVIGRWQGDFLPPESADEVRAVFQRFLETGQPSASEHEMVRKDGSRLIVECNRKISRDAAGRFHRIHCLVQDVTKRKRAEEWSRLGLEEMSALNSLAHRVSASLSLDQVVEATLEGIAEAVVPDLMLFFLRRGDDLILEGGRPEGEQLEFVRSQAHHLGKCLCGLAGQGESVYARDIHSDPRCVLEECKLAGFRSFAALPLLKGDVTLGVLGLASIEERDFARQAAFLDALASQSAIGLQNALLYEQVREQLAQLEQEIAERQKARRALEGERNTLKNIIDLNPYGIAIYDAEGHYIRANKAFLDLFGQPPPAEYSIFNDPVLQKQGRQELVLSLKEGRVIKLTEDFWYNPSQAAPGLPDIQVCFNAVAFPLLDPDGRLEGVVAMFEDATECKRAQQSLAQSEERYRRLVEESPTVMFTVVDGRIEYANPASLKMFGASHPQDLIGRAYLDLVHPDGRLESKRRMDILLDKGGSTPLRQHRFLSLDGRVIEAESVGAAIQDSDRIVIHGMVHDITSRKRAEEALVRSEERHRRLIEASPNAILVHHEGRIEYVNPAAVQLLHATGPEEIIGRFYLDLVHPEDRVESARRIRKSLEEGWFPPRREHRLIALDGRVIEVETTGTVFEDQGRTLIQTTAQDVTERRRAAEALRESESRFREMAELLPTGVAEVDREMRMTFVNRAILEMYGFTQADIESGVSIPDYIAPEDMERALKHMERLMAGQNAGPAEYKLLRKDGSSFNVFLNPAPLFKDGEVVGMRGTLHDITERKRAEVALRESEEKYRTIIADMEEGYYETDLAGNLTFFNDSLCRILGYSAGELLGRNNRAFSSPEMARAVYRVFNQVYRTGISRHLMDYEIITSKGETRLLEGSVSLRRDQTGQPIGFRGIMRDVTERRRAEEARRESEQRYRDLFNGVNDFICSHDLEGRLLSANRSMAATLGYQPQEMIGLSIVEFMLPEYKQAFYDDYLSRIQAGERVEGVFKVVGRDGQRHYFEYSNSLVQQEGREPFVSVVARDITERIMAERELRKMEGELSQTRKMKALGTLAGGIAHDFNNILAAVIGYTELALDNVPQEHPNRRHLKQVLRASGRARDLVGQILAFSRQSAQEKSLIRLGQVVEEGLKLIRASLPSTIEIKQDIQVETGLVLADSSQIHQVLMNLCANAGHAMRDRGGLLEVSLQPVEVGPGKAAVKSGPPKGAYLRLRVRDTGQGMEPEIMDRIFDPYFTTKRPEEGTGLGLAVVHGIVQSHGGAITVASRLGEGSTFDVYLPVVEGEMSGPPVEHRGSAPRGSERILVVDDEKVLAEMCRQILERLGYGVTAVTSSLEALELFMTRPDGFDLVITDQTMPQMTGLQLAREMMRLRPDQRVILCSGFSEQVSAEKAQAMGIKRFVMKPLIASQIAEVVREVLDQET